MQLPPGVAATPFGFSHADWAAIQAAQSAIKAGEMATYT
jgi:hypothetical protein